VKVTLLSLSISISLSLSLTFSLSHFLSISLSLSLSLCLSAVLLSGMHHDKIFRLPGAYRHLVTIAKNVRLAPVHTSKTKLPHFDDDHDDMRSVDEDIVYDSWSYNRPTEPSLHSTDSTDSVGEETLDPVIPDRPLWTKVVDSSSSASSISTAPKVAEDPFSGHVESMWDSDILPELLYDVYSGSSSAAHARNIGLLPAVLTKTIDPKGPDSFGREEAGSPEIAGEKEVEGLRISFTLCASTYATTFLDHIVETINKKQLP
jgi:tRNA(Glu) U13 pseudouridine synthase TruD